MKSIITNLTGYVRVQNEAGETVESNNMVVYTGGDIITRLLANTANYQLSHMYFAYQNTAGTPSVVTPVRTDTAASAFHALVSPFDFVRAPVLTPVITASDVNHNGNQVTFSCIANAGSGAHGVPFSAANNSKVYALGIVCAPTGTYTGDILYAHYGLPTALAAVGSGQISATWMLQAN